MGLAKAIPGSGVLTVRPGMSEGAGYTQTMVFRSTPRALISQKLTVRVQCRPQCTRRRAVVGARVVVYGVVGTRGMGGGGVVEYWCPPVVRVRVATPALFPHCGCTGTTVTPHCGCTGTTVTPHCGCTGSTVAVPAPLWLYRLHCGCTGSTESPLWL